MWMSNFVEVCAGGGGLSSGFIEAGWSPLVINEVDGICQKYRQIGNSVPVDMVQHLAMSLEGGVS